MYLPIPDISTFSSLLTSLTFNSSQSSSQELVHYVHYERYHSLSRQQLFQTQPSSQPFTLSSMSSSRRLSGFGPQCSICDIGYSSYAVCTETSNWLGGIRTTEGFLVFDTKRLFRVVWSSFEPGALR
jgi:hypothetical protein